MLKAMRLSDPKPAEWTARFELHRKRIELACPQAAAQHIGSTAIPGIQAKDVVDILVGVTADELANTAAGLVSAGYVQEGNREGHIWLCWPAPEQREAVVHVVEAGGGVWQRRLAFRDHLRQHPAEARAYEALKRQIAERTDDWGEYTQQKTAFVARIARKSRLT